MTDMLVDMHCHTGAISNCCIQDANSILKTAKDYGYGGVVITNHYQEPYFTDSTHRQWIEKYINEWHSCRQIGDALSIKVFCGIEVTMLEKPSVHLLIYGADEEFLRSNLFLNRMPLCRLSELCREKDCALVQAHPFRGDCGFVDLSCVDGVEINCHPLYSNSFAKAVEEGAEKARIALTVGCDYHADSYRPKGGMYLPKSIDTDRGIADFILNSKSFHLKIHEPKDNSVYEKIYKVL